MSDLLNVHEVADIVGLSEYTILQAVREGDLPGYKIRGRVRVDRDDLAAWIEDRRITLEPKDETRRPAPSVGPRDVPAGGIRAIAKARKNAA